MPAPSTAAAVPEIPRLALPGSRLRRLGIDTGDELVAYLRSDSPICRAEGFSAHSRIELRIGERRIEAMLNVVHGELLAADEAGLSESAWLRLRPGPDERVVFAHAPSVESLAHVRAKIYGHALESGQIRAVMRDVAARRYSGMELAAFITACSDGHLSFEEIMALTEAMVDSGNHLHWPNPVVVDKHCIGGLAGNRTTPIVVAIVTALGLVMPKTSSRAITSPAGTADTMAVLAPVELDLGQMRSVVERTGGCIVWGGAMNLSPADDVLIRVERALDIDSEGQLVASVLSKKIAAGSTHVLIDIPMGPTAKVRDAQQGRSLSQLLQRVAAGFGLQLQALLTDGGQPVGRGIGPALEAHDVLAVLQCRPEAPADLRDRALLLAAALLRQGGLLHDEADAYLLAARTLASGRAWTQFQAICAAQGGLREPGRAAQQYPVASTLAGRVAAIDNRQLSRTAKLAGAPLAPLAGLSLDVRLGDRVDVGQPLFTVHAQSRGELAYALEYVSRHPRIVEVVPP
ncbi:thymidine phosphorylase family protein [Frateuria defendens]|uniref:thymidine phosphorylase family protein n=1 Tax=Frateuria defendens TaxID=2219559 RepID=UPI00069D3EAD|nr:thymidine phosphorylase family protein [Frateuria defendens]